MYISNLTHSLDEQGNIPKQIPKEAREMANFLALVVDATTKTNAYYAYINRNSVLLERVSWCS